MCEKIERPEYGTEWMSGLGNIISKKLSLFIPSLLIFLAREILYSWIKYPVAKQWEYLEKNPPLSTGRRSCQIEGADEEEKRQSEVLVFLPTLCFVPRSSFRAFRSTRWGTNRRFVGRPLLYLHFQSKGNLSNAIGSIGSNCLTSPSIATLERSRLSLTSSRSCLFVTELSYFDIWAFLG